MTHDFNQRITNNLAESTYKSFEKLRKKQRISIMWGGWGLVRGEGGEFVNRLAQNKFIRKVNQ